MKGLGVGQSEVNEPGGPEAWDVGRRVEAGRWNPRGSSGPELRLRFPGGILLKNCLVPLLKTEKPEGKMRHLIAKCKAIQGAQRGGWCPTVNCRMF